MSTSTIIPDSAPPAVIPVGLQAEIDANRKKIHTDSYPMSLGELINMYRDGELDIHPAYQRLFRWSEKQKSKLIDSILLGIPIPSIFVSQRPDGVWELVDGLQRIGTILELVGILRDTSEKELPRLVLSGTNTLPALEGKYWPDEKADPGDPNALTQQQRLLIKRAKIDVQIVKKESDAGSKYELFQRLNTTSSPLEPMEIRNCLLIMVDPSFSDWLKSLADDPNFKVCMPLSEKQQEELFDREMVSRFLVFRNLSEEYLRNIGDVNLFLDDRLLEFARDPGYDRATEEKAFRNTFALLAATTGEDAFRRYDPIKGRFLGMFLVSAYEVVALGLGNRDPNSKVNDPDQIRKITTGLWSDANFAKNSGAGVSASRRVRTTIPLGRMLFNAI